MNQFLLQFHRGRLRAPLLASKAPRRPVARGDNLLADKIGGVPNVRKKDNLYQAAAIGVFLIAGAVVGGFLGEWPQGVLLGGLAGLIAGTLISGAVLTVIGLCRKS